MPGYFYTENYVDNFTVMSTSQKCYTQITIRFLRVLLFERNFFFFGRKAELLPNIKYLNYVLSLNKTSYNCKTQVSLS